MNRRTTIKSLIGFVAVGFSSFSIYEWFNINSKIDISSLKQKKTIIAELAETIIPRTNTPGAKDAKVEDFILGVIEFCTEPREQHFFYTGLVDLQDYSVKNYNRQFIDCTKSEKAAILKHFENKAGYSINILNKINNKFLGKPFFLKLKELTVQGYCNSQLGATQGLAYDFIPSTFQACIPLTKNQRSWATK